MITLPSALQALWDELQTVREEVLKEVEGIAQAQSDWRMAADEWSVGEIIHHLTIAEIHTGKLTTKLIREAQASEALRPYTQEVTAFTPLPPAPPGPAEAPPVVRPEHGRPIGALVAEINAIRERSWESFEKLASIDPRPLTFRHFALGDLDLAQWWMLQARHDRTHLEQIHGVKASPGFPIEARP
jgi:hypothetical protein